MRMRIYQGNLSSWYNNLKPSPVGSLVNVVFKKKILSALLIQSAILTTSVLYRVYFKMLEKRSI